MVEKALVIKGPVKDLSDLLRIARVEAKKAFGISKVRVSPIVYPHGKDSYLVVVEPDISCCSKASGVGGGKSEKK